VTLSVVGALQGAEMTEFGKKKRILALFDVDGTLTVPRGVSIASDSHFLIRILGSNTRGL
jgi:hypothetical protein